MDDRAKVEQAVNQVVYGVNKASKAVAQAVERVERSFRPPQPASSLMAYRASLRAKKAPTFLIWLLGSVLLCGLLGLFFDLWSTQMTITFSTGRSSVIPSPNAVAVDWMLIFIAIQAGWAAICIMLQQMRRDRRKLTPGEKLSLDLLLKCYSERDFTRRFGHEGVMVLDDAAKNLLQCRAMLAQPVWREREVSPHRFQAGEQAKAASEAAMLQVVRLVALDQDLEEGARVTAQLAHLRENLQRMTGSPAEPGSQAESSENAIPFVLYTLREIEAAENEIRQSTGH